MAGRHIERQRDEPEKKEGKKILFKEMLTSLIAAVMTDCSEFNGVAVLIFFSFSIFILNFNLVKSQSNNNSNNIINELHKAIITASIKVAMMAVKETICTS